MIRMFVLMLILDATAVHADDPAPAYISSFGYGSIVVSGAGYPPMNIFDRTLFEYDPVKKVFYVKLGGDMTIDMRQILPKGITMGKCQENVVREKGRNLKYRTVDVQFWSIWASHDAAGNRLDDGTRPWPSGPGDIPLWDPVVNCCWPQEERYLSDSTSGFRWESIGPDPSRREALKAALLKLRPGHKLYVIFRVGYAYEVPAGLGEDRWDPQKKEWLRLTSMGAEGYVLSDPISACTIELR